MAADVVVLDRLLDLWHMTGDALAACAVGCVMSVRGDSDFESCRIVLRVTGEADLVASCDQVRRVLIAVHLMAIEAANVPVIHVALHEVVSLHAIFVGCHVRVLIEVGGSRTQFFKVPISRQALSRLIADRPIVIFALNWVGYWPTLTMALDAGVVACNEVKLFRVHDIFASRTLDVKTAGAVALLTANVPLRDLLGLDVVVDRMASIAEGTGRALRVGLTVERHPPVSPFFNMKRQPFGFLDVPLGGQDKVVVTDPCKKSLLPSTAIDEGDLSEIKS